MHASSTQRHDAADRRGDRHERVKTGRMLAGRPGRRDRATTATARQDQRRGLVAASTCHCQEARPPKTTQPQAGELAQQSVAVIAGASSLKLRIDHARLLPRLRPIMMKNPPSR